MQLLSHDSSSTSLASSQEESKHSLCPTRSSTFMPRVRHTPPCRLSRPSLVPSEVAVREGTEAEDDPTEFGPYSASRP